MDSEILAILIIHSYVGHDALRLAHRHAMSYSLLESLGILRVFLLAEIPNHETFITQEQIQAEQDRFNDIVQGNFLENYRNLTLKHIMGLKWAVKECKSAHFIVKMDDDIIFNIFRIAKQLEKLRTVQEFDETVYKAVNDKSYNDNAIDNILSSHLINYNDKKLFLAGLTFRYMKPYRSNSSKWYVSQQEYAKDSYPIYLSGSLYITSIGTAHQLVTESMYEPFFWIDDVWITGVLRDKIHIPIIELNKWYSIKSSILECIDDFKKYMLTCNYIIGFNGGDINSIKEFTKAAMKCDLDECFVRHPNQQNTCITEGKHFVNEHGKAVVEKLDFKVKYLR